MIERPLFQGCTTILDCFEMHKNLLEMVDGRKCVLHFQSISIQDDTKSLDIVIF